MLQQSTRQPELVAVPDRPPVSRPIVGALVILLIFIGGLAAWAALAPLDSGAVAPGRVTVASNRKTIQHLEGGIIKELLVKEGDAVAAGQVLIRLDDTQPQARIGLLRSRQDTALAREARLIAELEGAEAIAFPQTLKMRQDEPEVAKLLAAEKAVFAARRRVFQGRIDIFRKRIVQLEKEIGSLQAQVVAASKRLALVEKERVGVEELVNEGGIAEARLWKLLQSMAELEGRRGEHQGLIARAQQRIGEADLEIIDLDNSMMNQVVSELRDVQPELADIRQRLKAAEHILVRTEIRAPQAGIVVGLNVHTETGVITPGGPILDIVPQNDTLVIEAMVNPTDIDVVHVGLPARVRLSAFKQRNTPQLEGHVTRVSADSLTDERSGVPYYLVRIDIDAAELEKLEGRKLYPGMPAEAIIVTGAQTALDYTLAPVTDSFRRAFRED